MKTIAIILITICSTVALAQKGAKSFKREYGMAGCGLGSVLVGKQGGQLFASTTNGTAFNQMFGITFGTLNCVDSASSQVTGRMDQFILVNRAQVQGDVARGSGETISALASYMGCDSSAGAVGQALRQNYKSIFTEEFHPNEVTDGIISVILEDPNLSVQCKQLG